MHKKDITATLRPPYRHRTETTVILLLVSFIYAWMVVCNIKKTYRYRSCKNTLQYMELARTLRHYGRLPAGEAATDSMSTLGGGNDTTYKVRVSLGSRELTLTSITHPNREQRFKVTRMRCWRITTLHCVSCFFLFN